MSAGYFLYDLYVCMFRYEVGHVSSAPMPVMIPALASLQQYLAYAVYAPVQPRGQMLLMWGTRSNPTEHGMCSAST